MALANSPEGSDLARALRKRPFRRPGENLIQVALVLCAVVSIATTFAIIYVLFSDAIGFFREVSFWHFFNPGNEWQTLFNPRSFGVWELVLGTINVTLWSMIIALPLGLAAAVYLSEYARMCRRTRMCSSPLLEVLEGIPTVVYGFFALTLHLRRRAPTPASAFKVSGVQLPLSAGIVIGES